MKFLKLLLLVTTFIYAGFNNVKSDFIPVEKAFKVEATQKGENIEAKFIIADDIHLNADDSLKVLITSPENEELKVKFPKAHEHDGSMVYEKEISFKIPLKDIYAVTSDDYTLAINFSGCADKGGICYTAQSRTFKFKGNPNPTSTWDKIANALDEANPIAIVNILVHESSFFTIFLFFLIGVFLALTPCIFPMIPILSSIIVSQQSEDEKPSAFKGFIISLVYVLSMAITYTIVGVLSAMLGADIQTAVNNPWVHTIFALMFFALALSLFGYYEIQLPSSWQSKINAISDDAQGSGILGTVIMGFLSAFIIGPCVAPPLAGAVMFISQTGDALLGGLALFAMSIGMGLPLLLVGAGAGKFMPRPGGWMTAVSQTFGVVMLGLSIFMFDKVISEETTMLLWSLLFMGTAFYMGVFNDSSARKGITKLFSLLAFIFLIYGALLFVGYLTGAKSIFKPLEKFTTAKVASVDTVKTSEHIAKTDYSIDKLKAEIALSKKPVIIDFRKKGCPSCDELERDTFPDKAVKKELERFTFITVDTTNETDEIVALKKKYNIPGTPTIIFFDKDNKLLPSKTMVGFVKPKKFANHLKSM